jgi:hypothetical protein
MNTTGNQQKSRISSLTSAVWMAAIGLCLASTLASAPRAFAAGLKVTGGTLTVNSPTTANFILTGTFFTLTGPIQSTVGSYGVFCNPCSSSLDISFGAPSQDYSFPGDGRVKSNNTPSSVLPILNWNTIFNGGPTYIIINGPPITLTGPGYYVGTTSYSLTVCGIKTVTSTPHCDVTLPYQSGTGSVVVRIDKDPSTGDLHTVSATYFFQ